MAPFTIAYGYNGKPTFANSQWISSSFPLTVGNNATGPRSHLNICSVFVRMIQYILTSVQVSMIRFWSTLIIMHAIVFPQGPYNGYGGLDYHQAYFLTSGVHHLRVDLKPRGSVMGFDISGTISNHLLKHGTCNPSFMAADAGPDISICRNECATIGAAPVSGMTAYNWFNLPGLFRFLEDPFYYSMSDNKYLLCY